MRLRRKASAASARLVSLVTRRVNLASNFIPHSCGTWFDGSTIKMAHIGAQKEIDERRRVR